MKYIYHKIQVFDEQHESVRGVELERSDYLEEIDDFARDVPSLDGQQDEGEAEDPMETEYEIPLDMEEEAFYYCAG